MMTDRSGEPWSGTNYKGFAGTGPAGGPDPNAGRAAYERDPDGLYMDRPDPRRFEPHEYKRPHRPRRGVSRNMLLIGVLAAVVLGLLFGVLARPDLVEVAEREPMQPVTSEEAAAPPMPVEVLEPAPPPVVKSAEPLEVLPPELAEAAEARAPVARRAPERPAPVERAQAPDPAPASARERDFAERPAPPPIRAAAPQPAFNCRYARSRSEQMVCADPELARLDRRLNRAFEEAVASGVPYRALRAEQDDWLAIREDAARRSPRAVESVYRQRIQELNEMAEPLG